MWQVLESEGVTDEEQASKVQELAEEIQKELEQVFTCIKSTPIVPTFTRNCTTYSKIHSCPELQVWASCANVSIVNAAR